ncbi:hypothetical protein [Tunturiibacter lichenicola]|uniref:hypothetical protein n=1 Tax=Tunturiibacter lichenicola TaxID=2051959 RepID=UPI0021B2F1E6|nr:hypothetical protein [Edaphobacter lichenicola]
MHSHPATTKIIKSGKSGSLYLLFTGNRKQSDDLAADAVTEVLISLLIAVAAVVVTVCIYAFATGKLG